MTITSPHLLCPSSDSPLHATYSTAAIPARSLSAHTPSSFPSYALFISPLVPTLFCSCA